MIPAESFNRTFMELKLGKPMDVQYGDGSFNRTFMELKSHNYSDLISLLEGFNRTFMELKSPHGWHVRVRHPF